MENIGNWRSRGKAVAGWLIMVSLLLPFELRAGDPARQRNGARIMAMADAGTAVTGDIWAVYRNPALLPNDSWTFSASVAPAPFGLQELSQGAAVLGGGGARWSGAVSFQTVGFELYREHEISAAAAFLIDDGMRTGAMLAWRQYAIHGYGSTGVLLFDIGAAADISRTVTIGAAVTSLNRPQIGATRERLPLAASLGAMLAASSRLVVALDVAKDLRHPADIRLGVEAIPLPVLALRGGAASEPMRFTAGAGVRHAGLQLDYAISSHPDLGQTHALTLAVSLRAD